MTVPTVFDLCTPRQDVRDGSISDSDFAANLSRVLRGDASADYADPKQFFANTYPTEGLKELLSNVCRRLSGQGQAISAVFRLDTSFGGGKTHGLIALVHAAHGLQGVSNVAEFVDPKIVPASKVRVAAFDGENADAANGRPMGDGIRAFTPWGEIAYQLAGKTGYEVVRRSDEDKVSPGSDTLRELFGSDPVLIVLDEMGEYLRKVQHMGGRDQLTAFLKALFTAAETSPYAAVVYTLAIRQDGKGVDAFGDENEFLARTMLELESVSGRKATHLNPTKDDETAKVIRRRIFSRIDDVAAAKVIDSYGALWQQNKSVLSEAGKRSTTIEEFRDCYPFHPDVLDTLTSKTATLGNFQRVRGMLRILAKTVRHVWDSKPKDASAIHIHHIDPGYEDVRTEFTTRLQQANFISAIKGDIATIDQKPALAQEIDANYKGMLPYASYVARAVFVHTFAFNNELKGISPDHLRYTILNPETDLSFIDDARQRFRQDSAYLDDRPNAPLRFNAEANLTQVIGREEKNVDAEAARSELRDRIKQIFGGNIFEFVPFAAAPYDVPDDVGDGKPRLVLLSHDAVEVGADLKSVPDLVAKIYERKGSDAQGIRSLRNNLIFVLADEHQLSNMKAKMTRRLALHELSRPERLLELAPHQQEAVKIENGRAEHAIAIAIQNCYRHVLYPSKMGLGDGTATLGHAVIDLQNASEKPGSGQTQIFRQLQEQGKLRDASDNPDSPSFIRDRTPLKKGQMSARDLRDEFRKDPSLSILLSDDVFRKLIRKGIEEGVYIYQREGLLAGQGDPMPNIQIDEQAMIFTIDFAKSKGLWPRQVAVSLPKVPTGVGAGPSPVGGGDGSAPKIPTGFEDVAPPPPIPSVDNAHSFKAEGVLKEALKQVFEKARTKKVLQIDKVTIRLFDAGDAFKLVPVVATIQGSKRTIEMEGAYETKDKSTMEFRFVGSPTDASTIKSYLEPQFRAADDNNLSTVLTFEFEGGLALSGDTSEKFSERLTRFASAAAHVEATAEVL
ncbi:ATP-binding protein [Bradyrhizobium sp. CCBAU 51627]|uniref:ATP-binding protein n=1 Tax=Bradyrhizobium sp. CCBAU 51627 TaxID=1325088 RepID=UPI0023052F93|nr:DUF499 domain-containing protein [Bradyrhizobium sp. CCBAU 51627]MDA9436274.1 hypothetical protein [Bradyrhizobium sp. CCBAU 51627]